MSISPLNYAESLRIGTVEFVSPNEIKASIEIDAPDGVALNTGVPRSFPRINGYVLIPSEEGQLVAQVEWITIERSDFPKRRGMKDFGLIDLPYPRRKMSLNPLGVLYETYAEKDDTASYEFERGVRTFPTVGEPVVLPTEIQLRSIIESGKNRHVKIGTSPLAANAEVRIDPDRLFGRHLAVLGNTGSGKSCSVAGLIRWSLEAAKAQTNEKSVNARFIVLDPNGEYARAFKDDEGATIYSVAPQETEGEKQLNVPLWFWNSEEWAAFTLATSKTQLPTLRNALRRVRSAQNESLKHDLNKNLAPMWANLSAKLDAGDFYEGWKSGPQLEAYQRDLEFYANSHEDFKEELLQLAEQVDSLLVRAKENGKYKSFATNDIKRVQSALSKLLHNEKRLDKKGRPNENSPLQFDLEDFILELERISREERLEQYNSFMIYRVHELLENHYIRQLGDESMSLEEWLSHKIDDPHCSPTITIIDLSLVPAEVTHIITSVIARMTLEALQRYRKLNDGKVLPTVLVMEEAHTFIKRYNQDAENQDAAMVCCKVFEKIAREGRKFGLGLVLSSQRPSELSPTVLSQCNSFLLHRLSNDRDQELVGKLVPDNLHGLLRDLPALPSRQAILLGWAAELPILVEMNKLPEHHRPRSDDPDFWKVWTGEARDVDWGEIAADWQGTPNGITSDSDGGAGFEADTQDFGDGDIPF